MATDRLAGAWGASLAIWLLAALGFRLDYGLGWGLLIAGGGLVVVGVVYAGLRRKHDG